MQSIKRKFNLKYLGLFFFLFLETFIYSSYNPNLCFQAYDLTKLSDYQFIVLKEQIKKTLRNSWSSEKKIDLLMDLTYLQRPIRCIEIGVFKGDSLLPVAAVLKLLKQGKIYAIDPWNNFETIKHLTDNNPHKRWWFNVNMKKIFNAFKKMLDFWQLNHVCEFIRLPSAQAVSQIAQKGEIDFLHIDGNFSRQGSIEDVQNYLPLVKSGGYVLLSKAFLIVNHKYVKAEAGNLILNSCEFVDSVDHGNSILYRKR